MHPAAPYFKEADLVIAADCVPFAYVNFHQEFLKDKAEANVDVTSDQIILEYEETKETPSKAHLRVLLRKFLHREELKEWFRVIAGKEKAFIIKERPGVSEE